MDAQDTFDWVLGTLVVVGFLFFLIKDGLMSDIVQQIQEDVDANATAVSDAFDAVEAEIKTLAQQVSDLQAQLLNNGSNAEINDSLTKLNASTTKLQQITADAKAAIAPPVVTPPPDAAPGTGDNQTTSG